MPLMGDITSARDPAHDGVQGAVAPGQPPNDPPHRPQFLPGRDFAHGLDFISLWRYNDPTGACGESFRRRQHPKAVKASEHDQGDAVDPQLKQLMKELGEAINESLSDSESIAEVVARIKEGGYDIFLVLEATIGVSKQGEHATDKTSLVSTLSTNAELKISDQDLKFLKSLRIKIEEED